MKKVILTLLLILVNISHTTPITFPDKETLQTRFHKRHYSHYLKQLDIVDRLAGKTVGPTEFLQAIESSYGAAETYQQTIEFAVLAEVGKCILIDLLLEEHHQAREEVCKLLDRDN